MRHLTGAAVTCVAIAVGIAVTGGLVLTAPARAAVLVGGRAQARIVAAFDASPAHRRLAVVSVRASTVQPSWAIVRWVAPERGGRTAAQSSAIGLGASFYHRVGGRELAGRPPAAAQADLERDFRVAVVYRGSGAETIDYEQDYHSVCAGAGLFTDTEHDTVSPMSWNVRYVVDLDDLLTAVRGSQGTTLVPSIAFSGAGSTLSAVEDLTRTVVDMGCNGTPAMYSCATTYRLGGSTPLSFPPSLGLEVGIPLIPVASGSCNPDDYTLGPSLFADGATTALVSRLDLLGGALPSDPYAPIAVSWPGGSAAHAEGFVSSPCQGDAAVCSDHLHWRGTVAIVPVS
ncbi:MAG: hypothetical protein ACLPZR_13085 [Solirubrobacteraceae bacterium]